MRGAGAVSRRGAGHRDAPPPARPWALAMRWERLLFAHWPVPPLLVAASLPAGLEPDLHDGRAWLGVVPFEMRGVRPRLVPALPGVSAFPELNLRTYVRHPGSPEGRPGIWFYSLDAGSRLAVRLARLGFHLPYFDAAVSATEEDGWVAYRAERRHRGAPPALLEARYRPCGPVSPSAPGSLEHFLTERYRFYSADRRGRLFRTEVLHDPWPLRPAEAEFGALELTEGTGVELSPRSPLLHYAERLDVVAWLPEAVPEGVGERRRAAAPALGAVRPQVPPGG